jgi:sugar/nucleoside kinase (ribokinase family)
MIDVLAAASGNPFLDIVFTGLPHVPAPGEEVNAKSLAFLPGGSLTSAIILTRLGYRVIYETQLGEDLPSRFLREAMEREGMLLDAVTIRPDARACVTVAYNQDGDRSFLSYTHPTPPPNPDLVDRYQPRAVLIDGLRLADAVIETLRRARRIGALRLGDVQDLAPTLADPGLGELLSELDVITLNEREAVQLTGRDTVPEAVEVLRTFVRIVVLKRGARGAQAFWPLGDIELPAIPTTAVDLTGCGDNFFAALTAAMLEGCVIGECLAWANAAGALAAAAPGGTGARYTRQQLLDLVARHYAGRPTANPPGWFNPEPSG